MQELAERESALAGKESKLAAAHADLAERTASLEGAKARLESDRRALEQREEALAAAQAEVRCHLSCPARAGAAAPHARLCPGLRVSPSMCGTSPGLVSLPHVCTPRKPSPRFCPVLQVRKARTTLELAQGELQDQQKRLAHREARTADLEAQVRAWGARRRCQLRALPAD